MGVNSHCDEGMISLWEMEQLTMIVEERGIPVWTRVRLPPGPLWEQGGCRTNRLKFGWYDNPLVLQKHI